MVRSGIDHRKRARWILHRASWPVSERQQPLVRWLSLTHDVFAEVGVGESHDGLERVGAGSVRNDGDVVSGSHPTIDLAKPYHDE